ncbi:hypothetical protein ACSBPU_02470 [Parapusillimonas sp. JC17]|uniref:hypothetical protein n=1 Tax=Parapusillimonas sp. JC17 TaxID=3445768 RepID=UPI003F9F6A83
MATELKIFSLKWYLDHNPDVAAAVAQGLVDAFQHFEQYGKAEGRSMGPLFDVDLYLEQNPDVAAAVARGETTAYDHFMQYGGGEGRAPSALFDEAFYLLQNPDVAAAVQAGAMTAVQHFLAYGQSEPRPFNPSIDLGAYLQANPDIAEAVQNGFISAMEHLMVYGAAEGRDLGNGVNLGVFANDNTFQQALSSGDITGALQRVGEVAPFLPTFQPPVGWTPPSDTPIPLDFVPPMGVQLVIPPTVVVPPDVVLPPVFTPPAPPGPTQGGGGGAGSPTFTVSSDSGGNLIFEGTATGDIKFIASATGGMFERSGVKASYDFADGETAIVLSVGAGSVVEANGHGPQVVKTSFGETLTGAHAESAAFNTILVGANDTSDSAWTITKGGLSIVINSGVRLTGGFDIQLDEGGVSFFGGEIAKGAAKTAVSGEHAIYVRTADDVSVVGTRFVSAKEENRDAQARAIEMQTGVAATINVDGAAFEGWVTGVYGNPNNKLLIKSATFNGNDVGIGTDGPAVLHVTNNAFNNSVVEDIGLTPKKIIGDVDISGNTYTDGGKPAINNGSATGLKEIKGTNVLVGTDAEDDLRGSDGTQTIFGSGGNDYIQGDSISNQGNDIIVGGDGADWLRGGTGATDGIDGNDLIFAGSQTSLDAGTGRYAESIDSGTLGWPKWFQTHTYTSWASQFADAANANILEGLGGNDILVASNQKDVFLYKIAPTKANAQVAVGTDIIHNFTVGTDRIAVVIEGDTTFVNGADKSTVSSQKHVNAEESGWTLDKNAEQYTLSFTATGEFEAVGSFHIILVGVQGDGQYEVNDFFLTSGSDSVL